MGACRRANIAIPLPIAARILLDALAGLHAAHETLDGSGQPLGVIHRDVSPHNLLVGRDGSTRVIDFGIAKMRDRVAQTASGLVKGKLAYMAPEQARARPIDRRADVWAAGVVAWELFVGRRLFDAENEVELALRLVTETPVRPSEAGAEIPAALDDLIADALEPDPDERMPTAAVFAERLRAAAPSIATVEDVAAFLEQSVPDLLVDRRRAALADRPAQAAADTATTETRSTSVVTADPQATRSPLFPLAAALGLVGALVWAGQAWLSQATSPQASAVAPPEPPIVSGAAPAPSGSGAASSPPPAPDATASAAGAPSAPSSARSAPSSRPVTAPRKSAAPNDGLFDSPYRAP
jgi:serine/threonine-protein kinase